jgi:hypothetical protein
MAQCTPQIRVVQEAERLKEATYRASNPDIVRLRSATFSEFLRDVAHWCHKGYSVDLDGPLTATATLFHCTLKKPLRRPLH